MANDVSTLAMGAGAAGGLETLLARMRAEETLRQHGRQIDIDEFNAHAGDTFRNKELGEKTREFDASQASDAPLKVAEAANYTATAGHSNAETEAVNDRNAVLRGLRTTIEGQGGTQGASGSDSGGTVSAGGSSAGASGVGGLDNPAGRLRLSLAGITPSAVFEKPSSEEEYLDSGAKARGLTDRNDPRYTFSMRNEDLAKKPASVIASGNLDLSRQRFGLQQEQAKQRQELNQLRIDAAKNRITQLPPLQREMALSEFNNRIQHDVTSTNWFQKWVLGEDDSSDPSTQIQSIANDVVSKYSGAGAGGAAGPAAAQTPTTPGNNAAGPAPANKHLRYNPQTKKFE